MNHAELERLLKIGVPIATICSVWAMGLFAWVYIRHWASGGSSSWIGLASIEVILLGAIVYFISFMRSKWGWFLKK